ncbi:glycosyltransferase family 4 protein [Chloroflexota bacterium]
MHIWILNHYARTPDTAGSTRHYSLARELTKHGHLISIFSSDFSHRTRKKERLEGKQNYKKENISGVEFIWVRTLPYLKGNDWRRVLNMLSYSFRIVHLGLKLKENPDVIMASSPHLFTGLSGYLLAKLKKAQFVFEVRDLWPQVFVEIGGYSSKSFVVRILRFIEKFLYQKARKIIVTMPRASIYITALGVSEDKIVYIPQVADEELFSNPGSTLPEELFEVISRLNSNGTLLVGYTGAHGIVDSLSKIIEAAVILREKQVDKVHFLMVGDGPEKEKLINVTRELGLDNISFFQPVPKSTMPALLGNLDIVTVTKKKSDLYKYGTSFLKLVDYMLCAKPIVWAVYSEDNPVAEANCGITVPPEDPQAMVNAIITLCDLSEKEREDMGIRGYEYVMKYHSVSVLANKLFEAIADVTRE